MNSKVLYYWSLLEEISFKYRMFFLEYYVKYMYKCIIKPTLNYCMYHNRNRCNSEQEVKMIAVFLGC